MARHTTLNRAGLFNLAIVYVVWGSTYLAIRLAVRPEGGFPPFHLAMMRTLSASAILFVWAALRHHALRPKPRELVVLAGSGLLMWVGGNGLVTWAEQRADSGLAALVVAVMPIWAALIEAVIDRRMPSFKLAGSLLIGFVGVGVLSWPVLRTGDASDMWALVALLIAPLTWAIGSIWVARRRPDLAIPVVSAWQHLLGGLGFVLVILLVGEGWTKPSGEAWLALGDCVHRLRGDPAPVARDPGHDLRLRQSRHCRLPGVAGYCRAGNRVDACGGGVGAGGDCGSVQ
jgi:drug/metabolite transporter (DMT)-like permease